MRKVVLAVAILTVPVLAAPAPAAAQSRKAAPKKAAADPRPQVQVAGVRVVGPGFGPENDLQRPFNWTKGTTVVVAVRVAPPFALVAIDKDNSSLEMSDSQGRALEEPAVDWNPDFTKDGTTALVDLEAKSVPADGATHVTAKGTLMFRAATGTKIVKAPSVRLEKGVPVKLGTASVAISEVEQDEGNGEWRVSFKGTTALMKGIKTIRAKDAKGAPVEAHWFSSGGWTEEYEVGYRFKMAAKAPLNLEFEMYDGLRDLPVAFDVKAGVGIPVQ